MIPPSPSNWLAWTWPFVGAFIGWLTNVFAIRMLFRPRRPIRFPLIGLTVQGLLPRRREELARSVGEAVSRHLLSVDRLMSELDFPGLKVGVVEAAARHASMRVREQMPRLVPSGVRAAVEGYVADLVAREASGLIDRMVEEAQRRVREDVDVARLVQEKILELDLDELENLVHSLARRELRHIEWMGAVLGFLIGLVQTGVAWVFRGSP